jgi:hypothetical protein
MEKLTQLTPEQESKLDVYRDMYLDKFFKNDTVTDEKELTEYVHWFYEQFTDANENGEKVKPKVILLNSPSAILKAISLCENTEVDITDMSNDEIQEIIDSRPDLPVKWYTPTYYLSAFNSWVAFYDFFDKECFTLDKSELFNQYKKVLDLNIFWSITFENAVFVSRNAIKFNRDNEFRLHSVHEGAIQFRDGYELFFIHGVNIEPELWEKLQNQTYTFSDFVQEKNEEVKNATLSFMEEKFGNEFLFRFLSDNLTEVDTYIDKKSDQYLEGTTKGMNVGVYTLFKGEVNNNELAFVRCYCPSTDRMFFLGVEPSNDNAKDAIASLYRVPVKLRSDIKYIQRQGERFSTVFTEEGKKKMKEMSKEDYQDLTPITGDEYFTLMTYEF